MELLGKCKKKNLDSLWIQVYTFAELYHLLPNVTETEQAVGLYAIH